MTKTNLVFINKDVGHGRQVVLLQGYSGAIYGHASWDSAFAGHAVRIPVEKWTLAMADDISRAYHMPMCRWITGVPESVEEPAAAVEPDAVIAPDAPVAVTEPAAPAVEPAESEPAASVESPAAAVTESDATPSEPGSYTTAGLAGLRFAQLLKIAKECGVENANSLNTSAALTDAILAKQ